MKLLLTDIGNTRIKYCTYSSGLFSKMKFIEHSKKNIIKELKELKKEFKDCKLIISNVLSGLNLKILNPEFILTERTKLPFKYNYIGKLGNDRKCSLAGALGLTKERNILVTDFGSATTYNFLSNKYFYGGMITTGLELSLKALIDGTTLPMNNKKYNSELLSNKTEGNITNGVYNQQLFMFYQTIEELNKRYKKIKIYITGGNGKLIKKYIKKKYEVEYIENLVLQGLYKIYQFNI